MDQEQEQKNEGHVHMCPYGPDQCPKVTELKHELEKVSNRLSLVIIILVASYGQETLALAASAGLL